MNIAKTTLSSKILTGDKEHFANLAVDAIMRLKGGSAQALGCVRSVGQSVSLRVQVLGCA